MPHITMQGGFLGKNLKKYVLYNLFDYKLSTYIVVLIFCNESMALFLHYNQ